MRGEAILKSGERVPTERPRVRSSACGSVHEPPHSREHTTCDGLIDPRPADDLAAQKRDTDDRRDEPEQGLHFHGDDAVLRKLPKDDPVRNDAELESSRGFDCARPVEAAALPDPSGMNESLGIADAAQDRQQRDEQDARHAGRFHGHLRLPIP